MPDHEKSTAAPEPQGVPDAESEQPIRQVFARRLDAESFARLTAELHRVYFARLEAGDGLAPDGESELQHQLAAVTQDLRLCVAALRQRATEPDQCDATERERAWCLLAGARAVEAEAVAERIERMLAHPHTAASPFPPGIEAAGIRPEVRR